MTQTTGRSVVAAKPDHASPRFRLPNTTQFLRYHAVPPAPASGPQRTFTLTFPLTDTSSSSISPVSRQRTHRYAHGPTYTCTYTGLPTTVAQPLQLSLGDNRRGLVDRPVDTDLFGTDFRSSHHTLTQLLHQGLSCVPVG
ncbi:hypothetical protein J6590_074783 [Homalodisca vitripennis]|nr:hypothetical protein J6590_074783 [Homalodisca vitripennis]